MSAGELCHRICDRGGDEWHLAVGFVAHAGRGVQPVRVVEADHCPGAAERIVRRHPNPGRCPAADEGRHRLLQWHAVGNAADLHRKLRRVSRGYVRSVGLEQRQILSITPQTEVGVQRRTWHAPVFARGEYEQIRVGRQIGAGKAPRVGRHDPVCQNPTREIHHVGAAVVDLDPIGEFSVLVSQRPVVQRHELGDAHQVIRAARGDRSKRQHDHCTKDFPKSHAMAFLLEKENVGLRIPNRRADVTAGIPGRISNLPSFFQLDRTERSGNHSVNSRNLKEPLCIR